MISDRPAIFLDRDGTLVEDTGYLRDPSTVELFSFVIEGLVELRRKGYLLYLVSNQSGVGRGIISTSEFESVHRRIVELLRGGGVELDGYGYCLHTPDAECGCRKPRPGLVPQFIYEDRVDLLKSFVIGDRRADVELAHAIGARPFLVMTREGVKTRRELQRSAFKGVWEAGDNLFEIAKKIPAL